MDMEIMAQVYDTLTGNLIEEYKFPGIKNAFSPGEPCDELYSKVFQAYQHICEREQIPEDEDVECIINNLLEICQIIGFRMFEYGIKYANKEITPAD